MKWVLLLAFFLRLINLNQSLWLDEAFQYKSTYFFSLKDLLAVYLPNDFNPPLSYLINFFFNRTFGWSVVALRLPSVIFGVLTVWLVYKLARLLFNKPKPAIFASLLLATAPLHLYYSQEARMYSLVTLAVTGSIWALVSFLKTNRHLIYYIFFSILIIYSHYLAWFIFPAHLAITFLLKRSKLKNLILSQLLSFLAFLPWLPIFLQQLQTGLAASSTSQEWSQVVGGFNLKQLLLIPIKFLIGRISIDNNLIFALALALPLALVSFLFFKALAKSNLALKTLFSWLIIPLLLIILISIKIPVLAYFRLLFLLPAFYLILTLGIINLKKSPQLLAFKALLLINLLCSAIYLLNPKFHREDWQALTQALVSLNQKPYPVLIISVVDAPVKYYYTSQNYVPTDNLSSVLDQPELWYIPYAEPIFDSQLQTRHQLSQAGFQEDFKQHFRGNLTLIKYIKPL